MLLVQLLVDCMLLMVKLWGRETLYTWIFGCMCGGIGAFKPHVVGGPTVIMMFSTLIPPVQLLPLSMRKGSLGHL